VIKVEAGAFSGQSKTIPRPSQVSQMILNLGPFDFAIVASKTKPASGYDRLTALPGVRPDVWAMSGVGIDSARA
jgi:hypothetical protein